MKKIPYYFMSLFALIIVLNGCSLHAESKTNVFQYKDSYIGDNSAVESIMKQLPYGEDVNQISLQTKEKPYGITVEYENVTTSTEEKQSLITNATYMFALIKNADWVTFNLQHETLTVTKETLENVYGTKLHTLENEKDVQQLIDKHVTSEESVNRLFQ
jgi:hypothetical protein